MTFRVTVRYGSRASRYHTFDVAADNMAMALRDTAAALPPEIAAQADLLELRVAADPEERRYVGEEA